MDDSQDVLKDKELNKINKEEHLDKLEKKSSTGSHHVRTVVASFLGFLALILVIVSILSFWLRGTLTNTDQYVETVAPLITKPEVQALVVDKATSALMDGEEGAQRVREAAGALVGEDIAAVATDQQLREQVEPVVRQSISSVVTSAKVAKLWEATNRSAHRELISQIKSDSNQIVLDFQPLMAGVVDELSTTQIGFIKDKLELKPDSGIVMIKDDQLVAIRKSYKDFNLAVLVILASAVILLTLCIVASVHHLKTARRVLMGSGIFCIVLAVILSSVGSMAKIGDSKTQQDASRVIFKSVTSSLQTTLIVIGIVCILGALGSKVYTEVKKKKGQKVQATKLS